jgi:hypothetical protein
MFGINVASDIFQNAIAELPAGLPGCKNISDDIILYGKDQLEHDLNLQAGLKRLSDCNVRLKKDKCHFSQSQVCFYGHIFSAKGVQVPWIPEPSTVNNKLKRREGSGSTGRFF